MLDIKNLEIQFKKILSARVVGIVADEHEGKTNTLFYFIDEVKKRYNSQVCAYFYHNEYKNLVEGVRFVNNLDELERVHDSFIFIDEFKELFQLDNRKFTTQTQRVFNLLLHNNNIIVLSGVPNYYKQFISSKVRQWVIKGLTFKNCVNGSSLKEYVLTLSGDYVGATRLNVPVNAALVDGSFYTIPYLKAYDKKSKNKNLFEVKK